MHSLHQSKSSHQTKKLPSGPLQVSCQERKHPEAIHFGVGFGENGFGIFEKAPQRIRDVFEVEPSGGWFWLPTASELMESYRVMEEECTKLRSAESSSRPRRIRKQRQLQEQNMSSRTPTFESYTRKSDSLRLILLIILKCHELPYERFLAFTRRATRVSQS